MHDPLRDETLQRFETALDNLRETTPGESEQSASQVRQIQEVCERMLVQLDAQRQSSQAALSAVSEQFAAVKDLVTSEEGASSALAEKEAAWEKARVALEERAASLQAELDEAKALVAAKDNSSDELKARTAAFEAQIEDLEEQVAEREKQFAALKDQLQSAEAASADHKKILEKSSGLEVQLSDLQARYELELAEKQKAAEALDEARQTMQTLDAKAQTAQEQLQELETLRQRVAEIDALQRTLSEERQARDAAERRLKDEMARGTKTILAEQLAEALREAEEAKEELHQLRAGGRQVMGEMPAAPVDNAHEEFDLPTEPPQATADTAADADRTRQEERITAVLKQGWPGQKRSIGEVLLEAGVLTEAQLDEVLDEQKLDPHHHLGAILIERGWVSEESVARVLASQVNAPFVALNQDDIEPTAIALLNGRLAIQHNCVPIRYTDDRVTVAMVNPMDLVAIEDLERATGRGVDVVVGTSSQIQGLLEYYYGEAIA